jgi:hypothetical protein
MSGIYWSPEEATVKDYSALTRGGKTVITIKLEVTDTYALSHILRNLDEAQRERPLPYRPSPKSKAERAAAREERLLLTDQREDRS